MILWGLVSARTDRIPSSKLVGEGVGGAVCGLVGETVVITVGATVGDHVGAFVGYRVVTTVASGMGVRLGLLLYRVASVGMGESVGGAENVMSASRSVLREGVCLGGNEGREGRSGSTFFFASDCSR